MILFILFRLCQSLPNGGPTPESCPLLHPVHTNNIGTDALSNVIPSGVGFIQQQTTPSPHVLEVETVEVNSSTVSIWVEYNQVNLTSAQHVGLALQARPDIGSGLSEEIIGTWVIPFLWLTCYETVSCFTQNANITNTVRHINLDLKPPRSLFEWIPPNGYVGRVRFIATIADDYETFWWDIPVIDRQGDLSQIFNSPNEFQRSSQTPLPSQVSVDALALSNPFPPNYRLEINGTSLDLSAFYRPLSTAASLIRTLNSTRQSSLVPTTFQSSPLTTYSLIETSACHVILFNFGLLFGSNLILYILHV